MRQSRYSVFVRNDADDQPRAVVHEALVGQLAHAGVDDRIAGQPARQASARRAVAPPAVAARAVVGVREVRPRGEHLVVEVAPAELAREAVCRVPRVRRCAAQRAPAAETGSRSAGTRSAVSVPSPARSSWSCSIAAGVARSQRSSCLRAAASPPGCRFGEGDFGGEAASEAAAASRVQADLRARRIRRASALAQRRARRHAGSRPASRG